MIWVIGSIVVVLMSYSYVVSVVSVLLGDGSVLRSRSGIK